MAGDESCFAAVRRSSRMAAADKAGHNNARSLALLPNPMANGAAIQRLKQ